MSYYLIRCLSFFISLLPYSAIHALGRGAGSIAYYLHRPFRKKALTNLAIAYGTTLDEKQRVFIAKKSFQNLMIICLEFFRFKRSYKNFNEIATLNSNPLIEELLAQKKGVIFLSAHQANWEVPFIALTERYRGIAIGRPIKNRRLYQLLLSIREMHGGKIVTPKNAIRASLKALAKGEFLGIVGDQAYPNSPYSYPLFGTRAWTASTPALLAYKTGAPLIVSTTKRLYGRYFITGSDPLWPNQNAPIKEEVPRLMDAAMQLLEKSIAEIPEQWMWVHDRWKQQGSDHVKRSYRYGFILVILPPHSSDHEAIPTLMRTIYPNSFLTFFTPKGAPHPQQECEIKEYQSEKDLLVRDWRFQLVLDFYGSRKARRHFLKLGAFKALHFDPQEERGPLSERVVKKLVKPGYLLDASQ